MKRRLLYLAPLLLIVFSIAATLVRPATAFAGSGPQYAMNFDPTQKAAINSCLSNHNCDRGYQTSDMYNVALFAKDGVYGSSPIQLNYEPHVPVGPYGPPGGYMKSDEFAFTGNYSCQNYSVSLLMTVDMGSLDQTSYPAKVYIDHIHNTSSGDDNTGGDPGTGYDYPLTIDRIQNGAVAYPDTALPQSCWPPGLDAPSQPQLFDGTRTVQLDNFTKLSSSAQNAWGSTVSSPTFASGAAGGPAGSTLSCDLGITGFNLTSILNAANPLNWLMCGLIKGASGIVTGLDKSINDSLSIGNNGKSDDPNNIFADSDGSCGPNGTSSVCNNYHDAWSQFRNIALGLTAVAGLIIVISQALGMEILDAYTIRKMLPRLLVATIGITLSWQLMRFAVTLSNDLGFGVGYLMWHPFATLHATIQTGGANNILGGLGSAVGVGILGFFGLLTFVGTAAISVITAFIVLTLRQIAVIVLIILSPVALIAYVLPNTQRVYKLWWESFSKMLLMFPLIVLFITAGQIFAGIASQNPNFVNQVIALIAYFAPYFMIPATFRMSGAMMSGLSGFVTNPADKAKGFLGNVRGNAAKGNMAKLQEGTRFEGKKWIPGSITAANKFGNISRGIGTGWNGRFGLGERGKTATANVLQAAAQRALKEPGMQAIAGKNDFNRILIEAMGDERRGHAGLVKHLMTGGDDGKTFLTKEQATARADTALVAAKTSGQFTKAHGIAALYNMAQDGTAIRDTKDLARLSALAGQGNANNTYTFAAKTASMSKQAGRPGLAASSETIGELAFRESDKTFNGGAARLYNPEAEGQKRKSDQELEFNSRVSALGNTQQYEVLTQAKGRDLRSGGEFMAEVLADDTGKYTPEQKQKVAIQYTTQINAIKAGTGADNKREEALKALQPAMDAYNKVMNTPVATTPINTTGEPIQMVKVRDVARQVGAAERHTLSQEEIEQQRQAGQTETPPEGEE